MRTIIICIDRDDDLGVKAGVPSPIIGRSANLDAAIRLGCADPEDSDTNTIFGGVNLYDEMIAEKEDVEIVSITGDKKVGVTADKKIAEQFDRLIEQLKPQRAILISDGAEDESVLPIIESRLKVDSVRRVIVKQHENLESTYYIIKQAFNDPKISHTFFMPLGLASMIYAITLYLGRPEVAFIFITGAVGIYMLFRGTGLDDALSDFWDSMKKSLNGGKITFVMYLAAIILSLVGTVKGVTELWHYYDMGVWEGILILLMGFVNAAVWWYVAAGVMISTGKIMDSRFSKERIGKKWAHPFFIISSGILFWTGSTYILVISKALDNYPFYPLIGNDLRFLFSMVFGAIVIAAIGARLSTRSN